MRLRRLLLPLGAAALLASGCGSEARLAEGEGDVSRGQELFTEKCASCHALEAAGAKGVIGPDLDEAFAYVRAESESQDFDVSTIRDVIRGQIAYPVEEPPTDAPGMPGQDELFKDSEDPDADADAVAAYVASVAGLPVEKKPGAQAQQEGGGADGKSIFASSGCGACHTFEAAGASGTVGPNLDESKPSLEVAIDRVTNGKGQMPAFKGDLTDAQIRAVSEFVSGGGGS